MTAAPFDFPEGHQPRRGRLMASGIILGLIGCLFGLLSAFYLIAFRLIFSGLPTASVITVSPGAGVTPSPVPPTTATNDLAGIQDFMVQAMTMAGIVFGVVALLFLFAAFGNMFLKRWSRPLALFLSTVWLYAGIGYVSSILIMIGPMQRQVMTQIDAAASGGMAAPAPGPDPGAIIGIMFAILAGFVFVFGILLPGLVLWLNWHKDVRVTLEFCDPKPRWTDSCPVPVLGLVFGAALTAAMMMPTMVFSWTFFPAFGAFLSGPPALIASGVVFLLLLGVAFGAYRRNIFAWALALLLIVAGGISGILTTLKGDYREFYASMGMAEEMIDQSMVSLEIMQQSPGFLALMIAAFLPVLAYLIWVFRFFRNDSDDAGTQISEAASAP